MYDLALKYAQEEAARRGVEIVDPLDPYATTEQRRLSHLEILKVLAVMTSALNDLEKLSRLKARSDGASFAEIGRACGISRQAARKKD